MTIFGFLVGLVIYVAIRLVLSGCYIVRPDQRAVLTSFGRAARVSKEAVDDPIFLMTRRSVTSIPRSR